MLPDYNSQFSELAAKRLSAEDLRMKGRAHRCETVSGSGRDRVTRYRSDVLCKAGSIEEPVWRRLVKDLAERSGEEKLLADLIANVTETLPYLHTKKEREEHALELYSVRIFDDEAWVGFLAFNQKYRPEVLAGVEVAEIETECCKRPGLTTKTRILLDRKTAPSRGTCCPSCGCWSPYRTVREFTMSKI